MACRILRKSTGGRCPFCASVQPEVASGSPPARGGSARGEGKMCPSDKKQKIFNQLVNAKKTPRTKSGKPKSQNAIDHPLPRHDRSSREYFLLGPIPWDWISRAAHCPGKALAVGIMLWHLGGLRDGTAVVKLSNHRVLEEMNLSSSSKSRALKALKKAGLIERLNEGTNEAPVVMILDCPKPNNNED